MSASTAAWPPAGQGLAALQAFSTAVCPVLTTCCWCGAEMCYGAETTRLQMELRVCSRCPPDGSLRQAMVEGIERGAADLAACERDEEHPTYCPPYPIGSTERSAWSRGWSGAFGAGDSDPERFQALFQQAVSMGWLRPCGGGAR